MRYKYKSLLAFLLLSFAVQAAASWVTFTSVTDWYPTLTLPSWRPPGWAFGPVWTLLYTLIGVSGWLVWLERDKKPIRIPMTVFGMQLAVNCAWSFLFFGLKNPALAFVDIVLLWGSILAMIITFSRVRFLAGALQFPYLLWVSYALTLNAAIAWMN
ncbi:tryptophan-rich sensory protein [bacterium]|nr:tryptophan-rich sensory protein [bacterium]